MKQVLRTLFFICIIGMAVSFFISLLCYINGKPNVAMISAFVCLGFIILAVISSAFRIFK